MKRKVTLLIALFCVSAHFTSCVKPVTYTKAAYYADDFIYTEDGYLYHHPMEMSDNTYIEVTFDNSTTPDDFTDDKIIAIN